MVERRTWRGARSATVGVALLLAMVASACGGTTTDPQAAAANDVGGGTVVPVDGGSLVIGVQGDATGWNPHVSAPAHAPAFMVSSMLEPLATTGEDGSPQPWLAVAWTPNATYDEWEVKLRDDVTFQNGEVFDAAAVAVNTMDAINGAVSSQVIKGVITDVVAVDPTTVRFTLSQPWAAFPNSYLSSAMTLMMAPSALIAEDRGDKQPIGTGPFEFDEWTAGDHLTVKKNPSYWRPGEPHLDQIEFKVITDGRSRANALISQDVDMMITTSAMDANDLDADDAGYQVIRDWDTQAEMVVLNTGEAVGGQPNPLNNVHARRALAMATDRGAVAAMVGDGIESPSSPFASSSPWGMPDDQTGYPDFDLDGAKREVEQYAADTGEATLQFSLLSTPDVDALAIAQLVQSQWKEAGIEASIETIEPSAYTGKVLTGSYNAAILAIYNAPDPDQDNYFWSAKTIGGDGGLNINLNQYTSPEIEAGLKAGRESGDPAERKAAYDEVVRQLNGAVTNVWLYWSPYSLIADARVHGLETAQRIPLVNFQFKPWFGELWIS